MTEISADKRDAFDKVLWVIYYRYLVVSVTVTLGVIGSVLAQAFAPLILGITLASLVLIYNSASLYYLKNQAAKLSTNIIIFICFFLLSLDALIITLLIHVTGSILSPFPLLYTYAIVIMAIVAPEKPNYLIALGFIIIILYETFLMLGHFLIFPPIAIAHYGTAIYQDPFVYRFTAVVFPAAIIILTTLTAALAKQLGKGRTTLFEQLS